MIKKLLLSTTLLGILVFFTSSSLDDNGKAGKTNAPGEQTCVNSCHNSFALNAGPGSITFSAAGMTNNTYTPGQAYDITVTVAQTGVGLFGVGVECLLNSTNTNAGTFTITDVASTRIKTVTVSGSSRNNVTHALNGGLSSGSKNFNFKWTAPAAGAGNVTFYFSGVAANASGNNNGDYVYNSSQILTEACTLPVQPSTITGGTNVCEASSDQYTVPAVSGATSYLWTLPSGWTGTSTTNTITVTAGPTSGDITVAAENTCGAGPVQTLAVVGNALPVPVITLIPSAVDTLTCNTSWGCQWNLNGNAIAGANYPTYVPTQNGNYTITVTDLNGCTGTSTDLQYTTLGISKAEQQNLISIYPSPASDFISLTVDGKLIDGELTIMDVRGNIVSKQVISQNVTRIELSNLAEGVYFAVIGNDENKSVKRFFVSR